MCNLYSNLSHSHEVFCPLTEFELLLIFQESKKLLSNVYDILLSFRSPNLVSKRRWEVELKEVISEVMWYQPFQFAHWFSSNVSIWKKQYKILHQGYLTLSRLAKLFSDVLPACWQCGSSIATFANIQCSCPMIKKFWRQVHRELQDMLGVFIPFTPAVFFCTFFIIHEAKYSCFLANLFNTAAMLIATQWRSSSAPVLEWQTDKNLMCFLCVSWLP